MRVARSEAAFDCLVSGGSFTVDAQEIAEQQRELLREAARFADVDVGPKLSW
jgi:predicted kinase